MTDPSKPTRRDIELSNLRDRITALGDRRPWFRDIMQAAMNEAFEHCDYDAAEVWLAFRTFVDASLEDQADGPAPDDGGFIPAREIAMLRAGQLMALRDAFWWIKPEALLELRSHLRDDARWQGMDGAQRLARAELLDATCRRLVTLGQGTSEYFAGRGEMIEAPADVSALDDLGLGQ